MPKLKSHSGAKKRFRVSGTGKVVAKAQGRRHNLSHKSRNRMRKLEGGVILNNVQGQAVRNVLTY